MRVPEVQPISVIKLIDHNVYRKGRGAHEILDRFRNSLVIRVLKLNHGNIRRSAADLKISVRMMKEWMKAAGIDRFYAMEMIDDND